MRAATRAGETRPGGWSRL